MARPASSHPTDLEMEILKVLWADGPSTVRHVREALKGFRDLAHTSVLTIMNIMVEKGYLQRARQGWQFVYRAKITRQATLRGMLHDMVDRVFDGSAGAVVLNLLETGKFDADTLKELREQIDRKYKEQKS